MQVSARTVYLQHALIRGEKIFDAAVADRW